jgi:DNA-binding MarR family transcriptional regulator
MLKLQSYTEFLILKLVHDDENITLRQIAHYLGSSLGTAHSKISLLVKKDYLTQVDISNNTRKKRYRYNLTRDGFRYMKILFTKLTNQMKEENI